jgi:SpoVK/Ycf46/Vps4 family AAA+-type ATPase
MNRNLMKRLFKSISSGDLKEIESMARVIVSHEHKSGHTKLSNELENIINSSKTLENIGKITENDNRGILNQLPRNKRKNTLLVNYVDHHSLGHEMILPDSVELKFARVEKEFAAQEKLALYGLLPKKKILLYGPPGCGKTLGAQRLAWKTGLPFYKVKLEAVLSSYLGESSSNLNEIFEMVTSIPCLLFIDEFDSIASARVGKNDVGEISRIVNSFLQYLDDYSGKGLLVTATNLADHLDSAIWRRFDEAIYIPKPGANEIKRLIKYTLANFIYTIFDWSEVINCAQGMSASQIVQACKNAAKLVILDNKDKVTQDILLNSLLEIRRESNEK